MTRVRLLFLSHLVALAFALGGLLIALPHPQLWAGSPNAARVYLFGMQYAGTVHILLGAATMLAFGLVCLGRRRTLVFFALATLLPLGMELLGTGTGWPFGAYAYTAGLGYKVLGRVPFTIPLSWFYMGFTAYLLANAILDARGRAARHRTAGALALGVWLLTVWDLALDPAMANPSLPIRFWTWHTSGPYFGMPVQNFAGWAMTGLLFMALSRLAWRRDVGPDEFPAWLPFGVYAANLAFAVALDLSVGLWQPALLALALGLLPASLALRGQPGRSGIASLGATPSIRLASRVIVRRRLALNVEGREHLPTSGPVLIAARHYHHLYDGAALLAALPRPVHILVALDWVSSPMLRRLMERACGAARWPVVVRGARSGARSGAFQQDEARRYLRHAIAEAVALLRAGEVLVVFPEGYPNVDPTYTPKRGDEFLPFRPGVAALAARAERGGPRVPIVPVGLTYAEDGGHVTLRLGRPLYVDEYRDRAALLCAVEERVRLGGRAYLLEEAGYRFDMGPTIVTAPDLLEELWASAGRQLADDVSLIPLSPFYRVHFGDGTRFEYGGNLDADEAEIARFEPRDVAGFHAFLAATERIYRRAFGDLAGQPFLTLGDFLRIVPELVRLGAARSVYAFASGYFRDPRLRSVFSFHPLFIGGNPLRASAIYSIIPFLERQGGVHFVAGGTAALIDAMARLFISLGGEIRTATPVERIVVASSRVAGVEVVGGERIAADAVVANSDVATTYLELVPPEHRRRVTAARLRRFHYSMSCFLLYLGLNRTYPHLRHHTVVIPRNYRGVLGEIFDGNRLPSELALYLHAPTRTDPRFAPPGGESLYVLAPVPHLGHHPPLDWDRESERFRDRIVQYLQDKVGLDELESSIVVERRFTPRDFATELRSLYGSAFSIEPTLLQSAYFRPHNRSSDLPGLYFVGAGTHPGAGLPGTLLSARITGHLVGEDLAAGRVGAAVSARRR